MQVPLDVVIMPYDAKCRTASTADEQTQEQDPRWYHNDLAAVPSPEHLTVALAIRPAQSVL